MEFTADNSDRTEAYLRLLSQHDRWLATYVYSLVSSTADADDILQEVKVTLWKRFDSFELGTNFKAWARTVALHQVLNYRRSQKRRDHAPLDDAFIEAVATEMDLQSDALEHKAEALNACLRKLPEAHRKMIVWRYYEDCGVEEIAMKSQRTIEAVYRLLSRIRVALGECVNRQLADQPHAST